ncbi:MAG: alpha-glucosidase C-terminal domain-containing protein [Acidobacteriia bacterium]|nr:alpha-glucosidase C-terminal domain-containing protein [Terriglobia bacterium]
MKSLRFIPSALLVILVVLVVLSLTQGLQAQTSVTIAGSLQSELGCAGDWDPSCAATFLSYDANDDVWQQTFTVPAGNYEYKAALDGNWNVNYGLHATPGGANIPLALAAPAAVKFYFDNKSHWITDNVNSVIATVPGSFQSEIGCSGDWDPGCLRSWLQDPSGSGTYSFTATIPQGSYEAKVAINESWDVNYGANGVQNGPNIPFKVQGASAQITFTYDPSSHILTITGGTPAHDNHVEWDGLRHDSRDTLYRASGGAVPAGTAVKIRFRTYHDDVTGVMLRNYDVNAAAEQLIPMQIAASDVPCYQDGLGSHTCDYWETTVKSDVPNNFWYRFIVSDGSDTAYYADNTPALDGGLGSASASVADNSYALMFYDPAFKSASWAKNAVIYQVFPDRFRNGRHNNDPHTGDFRYNDPVIALPWGTLPEGYCRNYADAATNCPWRFSSPGSGNVEQARSRDYFGGDLKGVDQEMDYLSWLGVNTLYFNPIFDAASNHGYDTRDYSKISPYFGTQKDWENLSKHAEYENIRIILDGVFNHLSSDSPFFDRYHHFHTPGACESASSPFRPWFTFRPPSPFEPSVCAPSVSGGTDTYYNGWAGFDSLPVITKTLPAVQRYFLTDWNSITRYWLRQGASGWRLDVMGDPSFPNGYWETFRQVTKQTRKDALIISELWQKDTTLLRFLRGDRADATMNYRLRDAVLGLLAPQNFDAKGFADSGRKLLPSEFAARLQSIREDYPDPAYFSMMNLLDSHDTARLLWVLTPGTDTRADKEFNSANLAEGKLRVQLASIIQFALPGAPTIYYGDEVGLTGADDPDDRRTYPWNSADHNLRDHYRSLIAARKNNVALTAGDFRMLQVNDTNETVAFGRKAARQGAILLLNRSQQAQTVNVPVDGYLHDGLQFTGLIAVQNTAGTTFSTTGGTLQATLNPESAILMTTGPVDLIPPAPPTGLKVTKESAGQVALSWNRTMRAAAYNVYTSVVSGGGYLKANSSLIKGTSFSPTGLTNATPYYFVVKAVDKDGNESNASNEVSGIPHLTIGWANLQWPPTITQTISVVNRTPNIYGQVWIDGVTNQPGPAPGLRAQVGFGPSGTNADSPAWLWLDTAFNADAGNNDEFVGSLLPSATGAFDYAYRYTTTNGRNWLYADLSGPATGSALANPGKMTVVASSDTTPPAAPANLRVVSSSVANIAIAWDAVTGDPTLYGYEVLRGGTSGGPYTIIATTTNNAYTDAAVIANATYFYVVRAIDQSYNRSGLSNEVSGVAKLRKVNLTFNVTVPATTDSTGFSVHIAGTLDLLDGGLPQWDPGATALAKVDGTHWTITLTGNEGVQLQYKYTLGSWDYVEKGAVCDEIANRQLTLTYGTTGNQTANDTVPNWRNVAPCGP